MALKLAFIYAPLLKSFFFFTRLMKEISGDYTFLLLSRLVCFVGQSRDATVDWAVGDNDIYLFLLRMTNLCVALHEEMPMMSAEWLENWL